MCFPMKVMGTFGYFLASQRSDFVVGFFVICNFVICKPQDNGG
jgi:hypothetical protein